MQSASQSLCVEATVMSVAMGNVEIGELKPQPDLVAHTNTKVIQAGISEV